MHVGSSLDDAAAAVRSVSDGDATVDPETRRVTAPVSGGSTVLVEAVRALDAAGVKIDDLALRRPTLDDVFLTLTGHAAEDVAVAEDRVSEGPRTRPEGSLRWPPSPRSPTPRPRCSAPPSGWLVHDGLVVTRRNLIQTLRVPESVFFSLVQPVIFVLMFAYVFGGAIPVPGADSRPERLAYREYLVPGIFGQTVAFAAAASTVGLAEDMHKGIVDRFRSLPMAASAVLFGRTAADALRQVLVLVVLSITGYVVGWRINNGARRRAPRLRPAPAVRLHRGVGRLVGRPAHAEPRDRQAPPA